MSNSKKIKYIKFPKGTTKKQKAIALQAQRAELGLAPWKPSDTPKRKKGCNKQQHQHVSINGKWGPHTKKVVCLTCDGAFVMWGKKSRNKTV